MLFIGTLEELEGDKIRLEGMFLVNEGEQRLSNPVFVKKETDQTYSRSLYSFKSIKIKELTEQAYFLELLRA